MAKWWRDLAVAKKLLTVVGIMAVLIATELFTLLFAMDVLSSVRSFVGGEGLWSKAQKNAVYNLHRYSQSSDEQHWNAFLRDLEISRGDHEARVALERTPFEPAKARAGFLRGGNHPDDVNGLIKLIRKFSGNYYVSGALTVWKDADAMIDQINASGVLLHDEILSQHSSAIKKRNIDKIMQTIDGINERLTPVEIRFSEILGEGSRSLETVLFWLLIAAVLTVESTGLLLTISFSLHLSRTLRAMTSAAQKVGEGHFEGRVPVNSRDELGLLAAAINKMSDSLSQSLGAKKIAESASQTKSMFLANMSHEIRNPLGVMLGLLEILKEPDLSRDDHERYVETMARTGRSLGRIINDILDLSKVEAGHLEIEASRFALSDFVNEVRGLLNVAAANVGTELRWQPLDGAPDFVATDRSRLRQILTNLITNALKYTPNGLVTIRYGLEGRELVFRVQDTGSGIRFADRARLFLPFSQLKGSRPAGAAAPEGTGLGLALSQSLARALGGDLNLVASEIGKGSTFEVRVIADQTVSRKSLTIQKPATGREAGGGSPRPSTSLSGRKILVVEDSEDNQMLLRLLLNRHGVLVEFADNGKVGFESALHGDHDAVLMDMQMPVMDGYRATQELRLHGFRKPILALTAHAMKEDRDKCLKAGCDDYLTKPIHERLLTEALIRHLEPLA